MKTRTLVLVFSLTGFVLAPAALINIGFHNGGTTVNAMTGRPDGTIVATTTDTWNNVANNGGVGTSFTGFSLVDDSGTATTATLDATSGFTTFNNNGWGTEDQDWVMMEGWYGFRDAEFVTVNNLPLTFTTSGYTVTIYGDSNVTSRTMDYVIGGTQLTIQDSATFSGTFSQGDNFVTFTGLSSSSFTITGNTTSSGRSAINGITITQIPEPSTLLLTGFAGLLLLRRSRP